MPSVEVACVIFVRILVMSYVASSFQISIAFATIYTELDAGVVSAAYFSLANATRTPQPRLLPRLLPLSSIFSSLNSSTLDTPFVPRQDILKG